MDRSGMAFEAAQLLTNKEGISAVTRTIAGAKITDVTVKPDAAEKIKKPAGRYITLEGEPFSQGMTSLLRRGLLQVIPPRGRLLAVGLGNPNITQDSLGSVCVRSMAARSGSRYSLAVIETDVSAKTGLETAGLVKAAAHEFGIDCIIAVDALACANPDYIGKTVQISNAGIIPGSGTGARSKELSREHLGIPIAAVGVPTVTALSTVTGKHDGRDYLVSTSDSDTVIKIWAEVIAGAIEDILQ